MAMKPTDCGLGPSDYYRADGQRIEKVANASLTWFQASRTSGQYDLNFATSGASTRYFYDGQMGMEDDYNPSGSVTVVNRYGLGARGIDRVERTENSTTTYGYPLYDGHGNMRATLGRNGTGYTTGTFKTYDVWGSVRSGGDSGDPTQKYCASLGHVSDGESGLIYMRARYHEPSTGRFISEDPGVAGKNWFAYCSNDPCNRQDPSGCRDYLKILLEAFGGIAGVYMVATGISNVARGTGRTVTAGVERIREGMIVLTLAYAVACTSDWHNSALTAAIGYALDSWLQSASAGLAAGARTSAALAVVACFVYALSVSYQILQIIVDDWKT